MRWPESTFDRVFLALALLGPILGLSAFLLDRRYERERALDRFGREASARAFELEKEVTQARAMVSALAALFESSERISYEEFRAFSREILSAVPGVKPQALEWVPSVTRAERSRIEEEEHPQGVVGFVVSELSPHGDLVAAGERPLYFPVYFVEPAQGNEMAIGLDLGSEPRRREALERAIRTGRPAVSGPVQLVQGTGTGFLVLVPAVRQGMEKWESSRGMQGLAVGVYRVEDLVVASFSGTKEETLGNVVFELSDGGGGGRGDLLYSSASTGARGSYERGSLRFPIDVGGKLWTLKTTPSASFLRDAQSVQPLLLGFGTMLGFELLLASVLATRKLWIERARRGENHFAESIIRSLPVGVAVADAEGRVVLANRTLQGMILGDSDLSVAENWANALSFYAKDADAPLPPQELPLARALKGEDVSEREVRVRGGSGSEDRWLAVSGAPLRDRGGSILGGVAAFRDIGEERRASELCRRLSSALEETDDGVFITDREGVFQYVNPGFERLTGYPFSEAVGKTPRLLKSGRQDPEYFRTLWTTILAGRTFRGSVVNRKRSGEMFHTEQAITPIRDRDTGEITHFVSVMRDLTERHRLAESEFQLKIAASVQGKLFPHQVPRLPGYEIAGSAAPAQDTCGDYYDFLALPHGRIGFVVADVSGHGVGAALIMAETRAFVHALIATDASITVILGQLNALLYRDIEDAQFVTMFLAFLDPRTGTLEWASMGHQPAFILDSLGAVKSRLDSTGVPLGMFEDAVCQRGKSAVLAPGDTLVVWTDGIPESRAGDAEYGPERALHAISRLIRRPAKEIADFTIYGARSFAGDAVPQDDMTLVVVKRIPEV